MSSTFIAVSLLDVLITILPTRFYGVSRFPLFTSPQNPQTPAQHSKVGQNVQAPVVQTLDSAIQRINHYPADKCYANQLRYPLDSDLSGG